MAYKPKKEAPRTMTRSDSLKAITRPAPTKTKKKPLNPFTQIKDALKKKGR